MRVSQQRAISAFRALLGALGADAARAPLSARGRANVSSFFEETEAYLDDWAARGNVCAPQSLWWRGLDGPVWYQSRNGSALIELERVGQLWTVRASIQARAATAGPDEDAGPYVPAAEWSPPVGVDTTYRLHALTAVAAVARALGVTEGVADPTMVAGVSPVA